MFWFDLGDTNCVMTNEQTFSVALYRRDAEGVLIKRTITGTPREVELAVSAALNQGFNFASRNLRTERALRAQVIDE